MSDVLFGLPGNDVLVESLCALKETEKGTCILRPFADGESYVRFLTPVRNRRVVLVCTLDRPDEKLLGLYLAAKTLRDMGASRIVLVAPYLPYMRQDTVFAPGEGISARHIAELLSSCFGGLVTVDPHLHRIARLEQIYTIPVRVVSAARAIAQWIAAEVRNPVLIGPDSESEQWVSAIAGIVGCPYRVLTKRRYGDRDVIVEAGALRIAADQSAVLVDDIVASGHTQAAALELLRRHKIASALSICVHPLFAGDAATVIRSAGAAVIASCNTVSHESNRIDLHADVRAALAALLETLR